MKAQYTSLVRGIAESIFASRSVRTGIKVLLIEDNPEDAHLVRQMLAEVGSPFEMRCADRLSTGLECLAREDIPVILLDLDLPDSQGLTTFVKVHNQAPQVAIIVLVAPGGEAAGVKAVQKGAEDYLIKGEICGAELVRAVRYAAKSREAREEMRKLHRQLDELAAELEEQNKVKAQFVAVLAHELRTPLTPVLGSARLLAEECQLEPGAPLSRLVQNIIRGAEQLESRLRDLLDLAQFQAGAYSLEIAPLDVGGLLREVASQFQPLAKSKGQTIALDLPQRLRLIKADRRRIGQVLMNLLDNAVKFTAEGGRIQLRAAAHDHDLVVEVSDDGPGLSPEERQRLFQPYYRSQVDRQRRPGTGLGLALCKQLVEAHGGKVWVESEPGKGSTFGFSIPFKGPYYKR